MKISGFTIIRNALQFDFPIVEAVRSVLDLVDEFVIFAGDSTDATDELLLQLDSPKVRIVKTEWDLQKYPQRCMIYAYQTDLALRECSGDWCVYVQSDEALHHDSIPVLRQAMERDLNDPRVEGYVLKYVHLYGNYEHYIDALHFAYPREIRVVRGHRDDIHSWRDAQSFRVIPDFDYKDYFQKEATRKLRCRVLDAYMYHYGWSRDPRCMMGKVVEHSRLTDVKSVENITMADYFDYGNLSYMPRFRGEHPRAMQQRVAACSWNALVRYTGPKPDMAKKFKLKYRIMSFIENRLLGGCRIGGFRNYTVVR